jgi:hypothetical protein
MEPSSKNPSEGRIFPSHRKNFLDIDKCIGTDLFCDSYQMNIWQCFSVLLKQSPVISTSKLSFSQSSEVSIHLYCPRLYIGTNDHHSPGNFQQTGSRGGRSRNVVQFMKYTFLSSTFCSTLFWSTCQKMKVRLYHAPPQTPK